MRLRPKAPLPAPPEASALADALPQQRTYLSREELDQHYGADPQDINQVSAFARAHGLVVVHASVAQRSVVLAGTTTEMAAAFGTQLHQYSYPEGTYRGRTGAVTVPAPLGDIVQGVFGLDDRPQAEAHFRVRPRAGTGAVVAHAAAQSFAPPQLAQLYQ
ncbi:MAG: peptidase S53, partial [Hymenobacter sp.]